MTALIYIEKPIGKCIAHPLNGPVPGEPVQVGLHSENTECPGTRTGEVECCRDSGLEESARRVQAMHDAAKRINDDILVLCHGGPIAEPADAQYILNHTEGIVGFYGASSMERLPVEPAIANRVREFTSLKL